MSGLLVTDLPPVGQVGCDRFPSAAVLHWPIEAPACAITGHGLPSCWSTAGRAAQDLDASFTAGSELGAPLSEERPQLNDIHVAELQTSA
jgi:hypothetical protein